MNPHSTLAKPFEPQTQNSELWIALNTRYWRLFNIMIWLCLFGLFSSVTLASNHVLDDHWEFHQSEKLLTLAELKNVTQWQDVEVPGLLPTNPMLGIFGVYRYRFNTTIDILNINQDLSLYIPGIRHGDVTLLNSKLIGKTGTLIHNWDLLTDNPANLPRVYPLPKDSLKLFNNELIIWVNLGFAQSKKSMLPGGVGLTGEPVILSKYDAYFRYYQKQIDIYVFDSIIVLLGLIDLALIFLLFRHTFHHFTEFKWLVISSVLLFLGNFLLDIGYLTGVTNSFTRTILMVGILFSPLASALFFNSQHGFISRKYIPVLIVIITSLIALIMFPFVAVSIKHYAWVLWNWIIMALFAFSLFCAVLSIKQRRLGSVTILIGFIAYLVLIRTQWLPNDGFENRNVVIGSLIFRYALVWAYFLKIREISINYRQLSTHMLTEMEASKQSIARDIHDELGQHLASAKLQQQLSETTSSNPHSSLLKQELQNAIDSMRRIINGLHPIVLERHTLKEAIIIETKRLQALHNIEIFVDFDNTDLSLVSNMHIFRLVQEAVGNSIKHSEAEQIRITLKHKANVLMLTIMDNGVGFEVASPLLLIKKQRALQGGFGGVSMRERVDILGGKLLIQSKLNQGTKVLISLPLKGNELA